MFITLLGFGLFPLCGCGNHGEIGITLGSRDQSSGLSRIDQGDGKTVATDLGGSPCRLLEERPETYLYLQVVPAYKKRMSGNVTVVVEYLVAKPGSFDVQYDTGIPDDPYTASAKRGRARRFRRVANGDV